MGQFYFGEVGQFYSGVNNCEREDGDVIRIISARKATDREAQYYRGDLSES